MGMIFRISRTVLLMLLAGFAMALVCGCKKTADEAPEVSVKVRAAHPTRGPISEEIEVDATLAPVAEAAISPRISAPIRAEYVERGARVRRGQLLVSLDDRDLKGSAIDSTGAVASARANYLATTQTTIPEEMKKAELESAQLKAALDVASRSARERQALYQQGALSGREADSAYAAEVQARAAYDAAVQHAALLARTTRLTDTQAAQGQLTSAEGRLQNARAQVSFADLRSPIDGVVTERPLFPGETAPAGTPVVTVMDTSSLLAKLHLAQGAAQRLTPGHRAKVTVPDVEGSIEATVSFISPALDPGSTTVEVWLKLPNAYGRLKVGTSVHAVIQGNTVVDAMRIPAGALVAGDNGSTDVVVITGGVAKKQAVMIGIRTQSAVQIVSGISYGDDVVTEGGYGLDDGTKVSMAKVNMAKAGGATEGKP